MPVPATPRTGEVIDSAGPGAGGAPLVALHGWTGSKEDFAEVVEDLATDRRVVVPDLPGHGTCPAPGDGDWGLAAHARWVLALLDAIGLDEVHLLGHSHGGLVAQRVAYLAAQRIRSLILVGTGLGALGEESRGVVEVVATAARDHGIAAAWSALEEFESSGTPAPAAEDAPARMPDQDVRQRFLAMAPEAVVGVGRNLITAVPLGAFLHGIDLPVLVCHGEDDRTWLPREQRMLAQRIPTASYAVIPGAEHSPARENPAGLLDVLIPFLDRADA